MEALDWVRVVSPASPEMHGSITTCFLEGLGGISLGQVIYERDRITIPVFEEGADSLIRVSTHLYNTEAEIDYLLNILTREKERQT